MDHKFSNIADLKLIVGLGNPGPRYKDTRHNVGFMVLDELAHKYHATAWKEADKASSCQITLSLPSGQLHTITLLKPLSGMNVSGIHIKPFLKNGIKPEQIALCYDEMEKPFGKSMIRFAGSARGHNGVRSAIEQIGPHFWQLRFGIARPAEKSMVADYVLSPFTAEEKIDLASKIDDCLAILGL
ncbi:aminoacyl-tRNA hydrolase [Candidatus Dependentiae bacterium]|nr:aminoacyl-tRNA hydrolase [Candidatus Dependentiae bacterium]